MNAQLLIDNSEQPSAKRFRPDGFALLVILSLFIGVFIGMAVVKISDSNQQTNETLLNETYEYGYNMGVVETSHIALTTGILPVFNVTEEGIEYLGDLNLTELIK